VKARGGKGVLNGTPFLICLTTREPAAVFFYVRSLPTYYTELDQDLEVIRMRFSQSPRREAMPPGVRCSNSQH
jgi:hypothetical protein